MPPGPPATYRISVDTGCNELDHEEMLAASGLFRRWAVQEEVDPSARTQLILWSADLERIATWAGPGWKAAGPSPWSYLKIVANVERRSTRVQSVSHRNSGGATWQVVRHTCSPAAFAVALAVAAVRVGRFDSDADETYRRTLPALRAALHNQAIPPQFSRTGAIRAIVRFLGESGMTRETLDLFKPFVLRFVRESQGLSI